MNSISPSSPLITNPYAGSKRRTEETPHVLPHPLSDRKRLHTNIRGTPSPYRGLLEEKHFSVIIGSEKMLRVVEESLGRFSPTPLPVDFVLDDELDKEAVPWSRDNRVINHDALHLIPFFEEFTLSLPMSYLQLYSLTGPHSDRGDLSNCSIGFKGIGFEYTHQAHQYATRTGAESVVSRCALEGGNLILFTDSEGNRKAVIGTHSIALSYKALNKQGIFDELHFAEALFPPETDILQLPLDEVFLIKARNLYLLRKADSHLKTEQIIRQFLSPITDDERANLEIVSDAHILAASWDYTKRLIARELNLPYENIAWVSQEAFHIDMDLCIIKDCIFVYDGDLAVEILDELLALPQYKDDALLLEYKEYALEKRSYYRALNEKNRPVFESIGLKMVPLAGRFQTKKPSFPDRPTINLFNGLLLPTVRPKELAYTVAPIKYHELALYFIEEIITSIPKGIVFRPLPICSLAEDSSHYYDPLGKMITNSKGGLRCMTNMPPQSFIIKEDASSPATTLTLPASSPALSEVVGEK